MSKIYVKSDVSGHVTILSEKGQPTGNHLNGTGWTNIQVNNDTFMATNAQGYTYLFDKNGNIIRPV
jgi:hypothetical protein